MEKPLSVTTHHLDLPDSVEAAIRERAERLERFFPSLVGCSVLVEGPGRHHRKGGPFNVQIDLRVPGGDPLVVSRRSEKDLRAAVRGAFEAATRRLDDFARVQRGEVKTLRQPRKTEGATPPRDSAGAQLELMRPEAVAVPASGVTSTS